MAQERKAWLDYVRFFSIFLVIVFHTPPRLALFDDAVILNLRVPVFFCISGFLYNINKYSGFKHYLLHRGRQILVPYTTFFIVIYLLWLTVGRHYLPAERSIDAGRPVFEFFFGDPRVVLAPFWYIACLFTMQMIYYWIERLVPRKWVMPVCLLLACLVYFAPCVGQQFQGMARTIGVQDALTHCVACVAGLSLHGAHGVGGSR